MSAQLALNQALSLHQSGRLAQAEPLYRQVLAAHSSHPQAWYLLGLLYYQQSRAPEALQAIKTALQHDPGAVDARVLEGVLLQGLGRGQEALESFSRATQLAPHHAEAWYNLGVVYTGLKRPDEALAAFDKALAITPTATAWNSHGAALQSLGRHAEALQSFDKALGLDGQFAGALYNRGVTLIEQGRFAEAVRSFQDMLALTPDAFEGWNNLGVALQGLNRPAEALESYDRALAIRADYVQAWNNRSGALQSLKRSDEVIAGYDKALAIDSGNVKSWTLRGEALLKLRRFDEALASFDRAFAIAPDALDILNFRASTLQRMNRFAEALECSDRAMAINPHDPVTLLTRAVLLCEIGRIEEGVDLYRRHAELVYGGKPVTAPDDPSHKQRHDAEQRAYLAAQAGAHRHGFQITDGEKCPVAVNADDALGVAARWQTSRPQIVVIDDFLSEAALEELRAFCLGSTIWRKSYQNGYLGASPETGFACPLLAQIADELRQGFPDIFGDDGLIMFWAFKYDSGLRGTRIHADQAAVNVNFWITPDEANCNPASGGLVIWDVTAPTDWELAKYNGDEAAMRAFLASAGARPTTIPYRANRAVIFNSDLFHETDAIDFKDGYLSRRINITMLFGRRTLHGT